MTVDGFRLVRQLTGGRHGAVWQGVETATAAPVALRELTGTDDAALASIRTEISRLRRVSNRHVAGSRDPVGDSGAYWLVEDWVEGLNLATIQAGTTELSRAQSLGVIRGALLGLAAVHDVGVCHGELSPRSIVIDTTGEPVVVGFAAHLADESVADADGYAGPEMRSGGHPAPTADVYVVGAMLDRLLPASDRPTAVSAVIERATAAEPADRHPDAGALLADLEHAAERAYGAGWWTTAGLSGVVASGTAVIAAGAVGGGVAGSGAVGGAMSSGSGALAGAEHTAGSGAVAAIRTGVRSGRRTGMLLAGAAVVVVAIVVGASAALRTGSNQAGDETVLAEPSQVAGSPAGQAPASQTPAVRTAASPTPKPTPTPKPNKTLTFSGTYRYESVVTKSNDRDEPVGDRYRTTWRVQTTCSGAICFSDVTDGDDDTFQLDTDGKAWTTKFTYTVECIWVDTGKETGQKIKMSYSRTLKPKYSKIGTLVSVSGTSHKRQLEKCKRQETPKSDVYAKITITKIK